MARSPRQRSGGTRVTRTRAPRYSTRAERKRLDPQQLEGLLDEVDERVDEVVVAMPLRPVAERQLHAERAAHVEHAGDEELPAGPRGQVREEGQIGQREHRDEGPRRHHPTEVQHALELQRLAEVLVQADRLVQGHVEEGYSEPPPVEAARSTGERRLSCDERERQCAAEQESRGVPGGQVLLVAERQEARAPASAPEAATRHTRARLPGPPRRGPRGAGAGACGAWCVKAGDPSERADAEAHRGVHPVARRAPCEHLGGAALTHAVQSGGRRRSGATTPSTEAHRAALLLHAIRRSLRAPRRWRWHGWT